MKRALGARGRHAGYRPMVERDKDLYLLFMTCTILSIH